MGHAGIGSRGGGGGNKLLYSIPDADERHSPKITQASLPLAPGCSRARQAMRQYPLQASQIAARGNTLPGMPRRVPPADLLHRLCGTSPLRTTGPQGTP